MQTSTGPASLLVVDDDGAAVRVVTDAAQSRGYHVACVRSLAETQAGFDSCAFDVALVDLGCDAESGFDLIRRITEQAPQAEIIVMSASTSLASAMQSSELSAFAFVQKPFEVGQLFATIERPWSGAA